MAMWTIQGKESQSELALTILFGWTMRAHAENVPGVQETSLLTILGVNALLMDRCEDPDGAPTKDEQSQTRRDILHDAIFGPLGAPVEDQFWKARIEEISSWLQRSPNISTCGKQRMIINLRELRASTLLARETFFTSNTPKLIGHRELALSEYQVCIEMFPTLPQPVQYVLRSKPARWLWRMATCINQHHTIFRGRPGLPAQQDTHHPGARFIQTIGGTICRTWGIGLSQAIALPRNGSGLLVGETCWRA
jgi:hypothetical protein